VIRTVTGTSLRSAQFARVYGLLQLTNYKQTPHSTAQHANISASGC